ncbi:hypothetical protein [Nakamurella sp.]|uniref:hypothetical protein n=1 Tax=Nakamurella sp. TaxID=1869182 RepID=UPI0037843810
MSATGGISGRRRFLLRGAVVAGFAAGAWLVGTATASAADADPTPPAGGPLDAAVAAVTTAGSEAAGLPAIAAQPGLPVAAVGTVVDAETTVVEVVSPVTVAVEPVAEPVQSVVEPVADAVEPVIDVAQPVIDPVTDAVQPVIDPVTDAVQPVIDAAQPVIEPVTDAVQPVIEPIAGAVQPALEPVRPVIQPVVDIGRPVAGSADQPVQPVDSPTGAGDVSRLTVLAALAETGDQLAAGRTAPAGIERPAVTFIARLLDPGRAGLGPDLSPPPGPSARTIAETGGPNPAQPFAPSPAAAVLGGPGCGATANGGTGGGGGGGACATHLAWPPSRVATGSPADGGASVGPHQRPHDATISPD